MTLDLQIQQAAKAVAEADALLIGAGAGMGVDSGLPDFRGNEGFWKAYPPYAKLGLSFGAMANPHWFEQDPAMAWGFYGHRLNLYHATKPHQGFQILRNWARRMTHGDFVYTSNVDGQFQRAGFSSKRIVECHGSIDWMQCTDTCGIDIFSADPYQVIVDEETMRAQEPLPRCPSCGALARPNILMFSDSDWDDARTQEQDIQMGLWLHSMGEAKIVIIECGAGLAIPSVRRWSAYVLAQKSNSTLIRINPREPDVPSGHISLPMKALEAIQTIQEWGSHD